MRFWNHRVPAEKTPADLAERARAVIGLWITGFRDPREIAEHLPGDPAPQDRDYVEKILRCRHPVIRRALDSGAVDVWAPIRGTIRCQGCGEKINVVPCRICRANGGRICYTDVSEEEQELTPCQSTSALPGTPRKLRVLRERWERGEPLWHPEDARWPPGSPAGVLDYQGGLLDKD